MKLLFELFLLLWIFQPLKSVKINETNLIEHLTPSEWKHFVGPNASQHFGVTYLNSNIPKIGLVNFTSNRLGRYFQLDLQKNDDLFDDKFVILKRKNGKSEIIDNQWNDTGCYYHSFSPHVAALDVCNGLRGILKSNEDEFYAISPLPERFHGLDETPHVIVRLENAAKLKDSLGKFIAVNEYSKLPKIRSKRAIWSPSELNVEIAIFVDQDLYRLMAVNFESNTEKEIIRFVLAMVNAVDLLYHDPSLGRQINFILKRLEILHSDPEGLIRSNDIDRFLSNFCKWQQTENPPQDSDPLHWDHAVILTGLDLFVTGKNGKISNQVVGLAPVAGMCTKTSSCTVNEGRHFESVYVVAHEIGHNLGMRHDGTSSDNNCDPTSYLMSPTLGSGKITWSTCSHEYLEKFLQSSQAGCLFDDSGTSGYMDHKQHGRLPGERFDAHEQCLLKYGRGSIHATSQDISEVCRDLHCQRDRYTWTSHPALEGTLCGPNKQCKMGLKSVVDYATSICSKYGQKVQRLSGLGMQLSSVPEDMDRPCRLACQDQTVQHRFYIVNGEIGWFPFGTDCARGDPDRRAFCLSGKCLDFGVDNMPLSVEEVTSHNNFSSNNRIKRSPSVQDSDYTVERIIQHFFNINKDKKKSTIDRDIISLDLENPIEIHIT
ncbi:PREDICTED: A disintegrin and metalloproteinase with thrombospondin motifs 16-like [Diuraphis noxia]|uniref:A disintegrin and metalloproteinase with thrombospondin motifs 16-like n=1 Tax=Diuraphis noxia TaxID=143948 RepID=UPI0007639493|nr:PREDICTED: A disintegrin and metalloproteinase with thrombospondin motifs 16-like [Diuraphis noxia]